MTQGDVVSTLSPISGGGTLIIRPSADTEWVIHNIYYGGSVDIIRTDGTNEATISSSSGPGALSGYFWHLTYTQYMIVVNKESGSIVIGYDGIVTK